GITNSFLHRGTKGVDRIEEANYVKKFILEIYFLFTNVNLGSVLYYYSLTKEDFSIAVPVTNALTLIVTYICDAVFRKELRSLKFMIGILLVTIGIFSNEQLFHTSNMDIEYSRPLL
ncbi:unnamed protein product, partial [Didymodactylos carnosus]